MAARRSGSERGSNGRRADLDTGEKRDLLEVVGVELEDRGAGGVERGGRGGRGGEKEEEGGEDGRTHGVVEKLLEAGGGARWS